jgi:Tol biopolymer transport system component
MTVIDRATGQHRALPGLTTEIGDSPVPGVVSPDGEWAAVYGSNAGSATQVHLINLTTSADRGLDIDLRGFEAPGMLAWSPDGKWLFVIGNRGVLYAYNVDTARLTDFGVLVPPVDQIVVRDVAG